MRKAKPRSDALISLGNAFTGLAVLYLLWFGWHVFVKDGGNPGGLGLAAAAMAVLQIMNAVRETV